MSKSRNIYLAKRVQTAKQRSKVNEILQIQDTENYFKKPIPKQSVFTSKTMKLKPEMVKNPKERNIIGTISKFYDQKQKQKTKFTKQWKMTKKEYKSFANPYSTLCSERGLRVSRAFSEINDRETFNFRFSSSNHRAKAKKEKMKEFTLFNNKKLKRAIQDLKERVKKDQTYYTKTLTQNTKKPGTRDKVNFDTTALQRYSQTQQQWRLQAKNMQKKSRRPKSQADLFSRSEKFIEKQSLNRDNAHLYKDLSMKVFDWARSLRQSGDEYCDTYIPVGVHPCQIYSKIPGMSRNRSDLQVKPEDMMADVKDSTDNKPKGSYYALKINTKRLHCIDKAGKLFVKGFNKIDKEIQYATSIPENTRFLVSTPNEDIKSVGFGDEDELGMTNE
ncbi:unnamed protein product [Moneuplotes crassus]|uniref:Uncharacterized protein n=1 Tax=Euplotes crassus TaxID=5936 RepID=A0AAD1UAR6_EUPCR|nr:unnamed protein product [Moneuplotes crassus]